MEEYMADNALGYTGDDSAAAIETEVMETEPMGEEVDNGETADATTETDTTEGEVSDQSESAPAVAANNGEDKASQTKAFSKRLNEMLAKAQDDKVNEFIAGMNWQNPYTNELIKTKADHEKFIAMHNAAQSGKDPIATAKIQNLEREISSMKIKERAAMLDEQDRELLNDKVFGEIYKDKREEVQALVMAAQQRGMNVDVKGAFNSILMQGDNFSKILEKTRANAEKAAIAKLKNNTASASGPLSNNFDPAPVDISKVPTEAFEQMVKDVKNGKKIRI